MSIIVQCGHNLTRSEEIMNILNEKGLSKPLKSSRTDLSSADVTAALDKIYKKTSKLVDNKLAESVAIDFLLTNLEIENWGWNDSKNLKTLHFWEWIEPDCKFVLVFDHPSEIFRYALKNNLSQNLLDNMIKDWVIFQKDLLKFFVDNKSKCILIEGNAALRDTKATEKCINLIAPELLFKHEETRISKKIIENKIPPNLVDGSKQKERLNNKLLHKLLNEYPELITTFDCLIENANIKINKDPIGKESLNREDFYSILRETQDINNIVNEDVIDSLKVELSRKESDVGKLKVLLDSSEKTNKEQASLVKILKQRAESSSHGLKQKNTVTVSIDNASNEMIELQKENKFILKQLHLVQKELEYYFNLKLSENTQKLHNTEQTKNDEKAHQYNDLQSIKEVQSIKKTENAAVVEIPKAAPFGAEKRIKMELPYRLGASIIEGSKSRRGILTIPKAIAMEYIDHNKNIASIADLPSIEEYGDFDKVEKIKQHLSYQIGEIVAESIKEPKKIITAPIKIGNRVLFFKKKEFTKKRKGS